MSSGRFDVFSDSGAVVGGESACAAVAGYLLARGAGQRLSPARVASDLGLEEDLVEELFELAAAPEVGLLIHETQLRCPHCEARIDAARLIVVPEDSGSAVCPGCEQEIPNPGGLRSESRYRLTPDAEAEAQARQAADAAKPTLRVVILCAILAEFAAIRAQMLSTGREVDRRTIEPGDTYLTTTLAGEHVNWEILAAVSDQSNPASAASIVNGINAFKPWIAVFIGVAGGIPGKIKLGDVVAATTVIDYERGKETVAGYEPREVHTQSAFPLTQLAGYVAVTDVWRRRITPAEDASTAQVKVEPIAAGDKVVAAWDSPTAELIRRTAPRAVAVEMEGAGFLGAVHRYRGVDGIVVRGISDMLDNKAGADGEGWQPRAAARACAFAFEMLASYQPPEGGELPPPPPAAAPQGPEPAEAPVELEALLADIASSEDAGRQETGLRRALAACSALDDGDKKMLRDAVEGAKTKGGTRAEKAKRQALITRLIKALR
jgi:nucleoside phosphorylase